MLNPEDEVCYHLRSSCTEEEAAAMMLGWLRAEKRARYIQVTLDGINPDQFPYLLSLPDTLEATIHEQREKASIEFHNAVVNGNIDIATEKEAIVEQWDEVAKRARRYIIDIGDELTKADSDLRIDQRTSIATGVTHITLKSLDQWSRKVHCIAILDDQDAPTPDTTPKEGERPWMHPDPRDLFNPKKDQHWYVPARFFARQLILEDPTLLIKRNQLAKKVAPLLTAAGIFKRGGKKEFQPGTILKAFSNITLG